MVELQQALDRPLPVARSRTGLWYMAAASIGLGLVALGLLFHEAVTGAVRVWIDSRTFNHCFLILPIAGYMIWQRRGAFAGLAPRPSWWALFLVVPAALLWLLGHVASVLEAEQLALVAMVQVLLLTVLGASVYRAFLFPFLYLFLLVPSGEYLTAPLQDFTARFILIGLRLLGIPVYSDGVLISIPNGDFQVAEACAGLRFLIASFAFGLLFAEQMYRSWWRRALFVAVSVTMPVIANGFRALGIVLIGHWSDMRYATGVDHILYGWIFFSLVLVGLMWIGMRFREDDKRPAPAVAIMPERARGTGVALVGAACLVVAIGAAAPVYAAWRESVPPSVDRAAIQPPAPEKGWELVAGPADSWRPIVESPDIERFATYRRGGDTVYLSLAFYATQRRGAKAVSAIERMADEHAWTRVTDQATPASIDGKQRQVLQTRIRSLQAGNRLVWSWYWIGGRVTASRPLAKLLQVETTLLEGRRSAAVIALATPYTDDAARAARVLQEFVTDMPSIDTMLDRATAG